jgi:3-oxoacyl-[acyl-carrier-protein] synthase-3
MNSIKILASGTYMPKTKILNEELEGKYNLEKDWIYKRSGIKARYKVENETITDLAICCVKNLMGNTHFDIRKVDLIIVATTSTDRLMPGISFRIQDFFNIERAICLDILSGCSGYINAFDIARKYIALGEVNYALVIGTEVLTKFLDEQDVNTSVLLGDGAGAVLIGKSKEEKYYLSDIRSDGKNGDILTCNTNEKLYMDGKKVYKYAVTETVNNINELLERAKQKLADIQYIIPHQSNIKILNSICDKLEIDISKMYINLETKGNTFCSSIPIAIDEMRNKKLLKDGDKIILMGYGGGLNLGSILLEV